MKLVSARFLPALVLVLSMQIDAQSAASQTIDQAWVSAGSTEKSQYFLDLNSLKHEGTELSGWTLLYLQDGHTVGGRRIGYGLLRQHWNCAAKTVRTSTSQYYLRNGDASEGFVNSERASEVIPGSVGENVLVNACALGPDLPIFEYQFRLNSTRHFELYSFISSKREAGQPLRQNQKVYYKDGVKEGYVIIRNDYAYWPTDGDCAVEADGSASVFIAGKWEALECSKGPRAIRSANITRIKALGFPSVAEAVAFCKDFLPWVNTRVNSKNTTPAKAKAKATAKSKAKKR